MKFSIRAYLVASMVLAAILLNGCAVIESVQQPPPRLVATLASVQNDYQQAALETAGTEEAINELEVTEPIDLELAYQAFTESADRIRQTGERLITHADEMRFSGASYLVESGKAPTACVYPRLRQPEDAKTAEYGEYFNAIADEGWEVKRAFRAFEFDVSQLQETLSMSRNLNMVEGMTPIIRKAKADGESFRESLAEALAAIERAKSVQSQAAQ
jgi:hypothetical protein